MRTLWVIAAILVGGAAPARAQVGGPPGAEEPAAEERTYIPPPTGKDIVIDIPGERSRNNKLLVGGLGAAGVLFGAVGVYFHLDSRDAANAVSANRATNEVWTAERQDAYDRAHSSRLTAGVMYGIGGAFVIATIATLIVTEPKSERTIIHPHSNPRPTVVPTQGGAMLGGMWSF